MFTFQARYVIMFAEVISVKVIRAENTATRAGAYYVRIQAMAKKYHITLEEEFDEHDNDETKSRVILDDVFPVATCRFYEIEDGAVMIGRVVVLPEYRGRGLGSRAVLSAEEWAGELGYTRAVLESRVEKTGFYEKLGYIADCDNIIEGGTFRCVHMEKSLL